METLIKRLSKNLVGVITSDIRKAFTVLFRARLFAPPAASDSDGLWSYTGQEDYLRQVDMAITSRIRAGCEERGIAFNSDVLRGVLYGQYNAKTIADLIDGAYSSSKAA